MQEFASFDFVNGDISHRVFRKEEWRGVGAIGLCLAGNFPIALMADDSVLAPVASELAILC